MILLRPSWLSIIHRLLRVVGRRQLHDNTLYDANGMPRLIFPTPDWEDFVQLATSELRLYGATNFQVSRRLFAMINNLLSSLPNRVSQRSNAS